MNFELKVETTLKCKLGKDGKPKHDGVSFCLVVPKPLDAKAYHNADGSLNADGVRTMTTILVETLSGNIHYAHEADIKDSAEHIREAIEKLSTSFIQVSNGFQIVDKDD